MKRIRILVVDDSIVMRKMLSVLFNEQRDMEVVGVAANGAEAVDQVRRLEPDVVTLDVLMPGMDGLEALTRIREFNKTVRVIVFSVTVSEKATATRDALARGADACVLKPSRVRDAPDAMEAIRSQLVPRVRAMVGRLGSSPGLGVIALPDGAGAALRRVRPQLVVIGVSTGGPEALARLLPELPDDFSSPILIVQHMPEIFIQYLQKRLDSRSRIRVVVGVEGAPLVPGVAVLAPGDRHLALMGSRATPRIHLSDAPPVNSCRPSADVLFKSAGALFGGDLVAVILTGMGSDGLAGAREIHAAGGAVIVQDEESSVVWGMPGSVARAGFAHLLGTPEQIAKELTRISKRGVGSVTRTPPAR